MNTEFDHDFDFDKVNVNLINIRKFYGRLSKEYPAIHSVADKMSLPFSNTCRVYAFARDIGLQSEFREMCHSDFNGESRYDEKWFDEVFDFIAKHKLIILLTYAL